MLKPLNDSLLMNASSYRMSTLRSIISLIINCFDKECSKFPFFTTLTRGVPQKTLPSQPMSVAVGQQFGASQRAREAVVCTVRSIVAVHEAGHVDHEIKTGRSQRKLFRKVTGGARVGARLGCLLGQRADGGGTRQVFKPTRGAAGTEAACPCLVAPAAHAFCAATEVQLGRSAEGGHTQ